VAGPENHVLELRWSRSPLLLAGAGLVIGVLANIVVVLVQLFVDPATAVALGIVIVCFLVPADWPEAWANSGKVPTGNRRDVFCAPPLILAPPQLLW